MSEALLAIVLGLSEPAPPPPKVCTEAPPAGQTCEGEDIATSEPD